MMKTVLATAFVLVTLPALAQVTPGGPGDRKLNESPPISASQSPAGTQPPTQSDYARPRGAPVTTGAAPGQAGSGQGGARRANEAPALGR